MRYAGKINLFPNGLEPPPNDFDANSVGFVDIEELRALEDSDCISVVSVPVLPHSVPVQRKPFASLRKWIPRRRRTTSRGYDNLASTIKRSSQDHYREIYRPRKSSMFDAPSVSSIALPYPSKKPSLRRKLQKFMFCGSR